MKIAVVTATYSEGMGYLENCLPQALAAIGHDVHVVTSAFNVYGNQADYDESYREFLGPARAEPGVRRIDGYTVHRLEPGLLFGYVWIKGLVARIAELAPDVVYAREIAALSTFSLALYRPVMSYRLFCATEQCLSVVRPYLKKKGSVLKKIVYRATRTVPTFLASLAVDHVHAAAPDCLEVAARLYGVPRRKMSLRSLGTNTEQFRPASSPAELSARALLREKLGFAPDDIVCIYSGRFSRDKNPLALAEAIESLRAVDPRFKGLFIGHGVQRDAILAHAHCVVLPFTPYGELAPFFRAADVAVWPRQESMSMLDAASTALPLIVSHRMGEPSRVAGNGLTYDEDSVPSLVAALRRLATPEVRRQLGAVGRQRMIDEFSWTRFARTLETDFLAAG